MTFKRLQQIVEQLDSYPITRRAIVAQAKGNRTAADAALLAVGNASEGSGGWVSTDEVRQFGLTVAYSLCDAVLSGLDYLPEVFTLDDVATAADVLAGEMSRGWGDD